MYMLKTLYDLETIGGRVAGALRLETLCKEFGQETVSTAIKEGLIETHKINCSGRERRCWLTEQGRKLAQR